MGKKKRKQKGRRGGPASKGGQPPVGLAARRWTFKQLLLVLLVGFVLGVALGYSLAPDAPTAGAGATEATEQETPTDRYGRTPDDPHYGHPHR